MIVGMMIGGGVLVVLIGIGGAYFLGAARRSAEFEVHRCRCPHCHQKVRYRGAEMNRELRCPRCRHRLPLPLTPQAQMNPVGMRQFSGW